MILQELQKQHPVEIEVELNNQKTTLISSVEDIVGDKPLLTPIKHNEKVIGFPKESSVSLYYIEDGRVYRWSHISIQVVKYNNQVYHSVSIVGDAEMLNRRGAYRVYVGERMPLTSFTANGPKRIQVLVKDISESGLAFLSEEEFSVGRTIRLQLELNEQHTLQLTAQIVRVQELEDRKENLYGCKFIERNNRLTAYLMKRQQERQKQKSGR